MIADLEQQLLELQVQAPPEPIDHQEADAMSGIDEDKVSSLSGREETNFEWAKVRQASILIACNLRCDPRRENKVLLPILFLISGFHFDHLCKWLVTIDVTLCMVTMFMNKWMFTFYKYKCFPFYFVYLMQGFQHILLDICKYLMMQSSIWQMVHTRTFEDAILDIPEGSVGHGSVQVPRGGAPPQPTVSLE
jgi:hypothetical protein